MIFIYGPLIALQIVLGQVLWKTGAEKYSFVLSKEYILSTDFIRFLFSPLTIFGIMAYGSATLIFMAMLAKYDYTNLQSVVVSSSLVFTFIAASVIFHERVSLVNLLGLVLLLLGVIFVTKF